MINTFAGALGSKEERNKIEEVYNKHKAMALRYALSITKNKEMAEDAVHNAFLSIIKHKEKILSLSCREMKNSIVIITKNKCIDILRGQKAFMDIDDSQIEDNLQSDEPSIEERLIRLDEYEAIRSRVASLDEIDRLVLEMKYVQKLTYKEIGEALGMTPKHVETKIMRAKEKVRRHAAKDGETNER